MGHKFICRKCKWEKWESTEWLGLGALAYTTLYLRQAAASVSSMKDMGPVLIFSFFKRNRKSVIYCEISPIFKCFSLAKKGKTSCENTPLACTQHTGHQFVNFLLRWQSLSWVSGKIHRWRRVSFLQLLSNSNCKLFLEILKFLDLTVKGLIINVCITPMLLSGCAHCKLPRKVKDKGWAVGLIIVWDQ